MLLYYGRQYDAASVGARVIGVVCEKCGCEYFYELARVGEGAASAPYAIGSAARSDRPPSKRRATWTGG